MSVRGKREMFVDSKLSQKIERAEGMANAAFVDSSQRIDPEVGACRVEIAGTMAMFDGVGSPCTQTFGLGLFDNVGEKEIGEIEAFFRDRGSDVFHEVSPLADAGLLSLLGERGYRAIEHSMVLYKELDAFDSGVGSNANISTRIIRPGETDVWVRTLANGWSTESEGLGEFMLGFGSVSAQCEGGLPWLAEIEGRPVAAAMLFVFDGLAVLAGASTIFEARGRGAQNALLSARLTYASKVGCTLAAMATAPGSQSQKNSQKNGFQIAYTRTKWHLGLERSATHLL